MCIPSATPGDEVDRASGRGGVGRGSPSGAAAACPRFAWRSTRCPRRGRGATRGPLPAGQGVWGGGGGQCTEFNPSAINGNRPCSRRSIRTREWPTDRPQGWCRGRCASAVLAGTTNGLRIRRWVVPFFPPPPLGVSGPTIRSKRVKKFTAAQSPPFCFRKAPHRCVAWIVSSDTPRRGSGPPGTPGQ